jgi:hypothetical protein
MPKDRSLRVYFGPDDNSSVPLSNVEAKDSQAVEVPLSTLFDTMTDATVQGLAWADDFRNEKVSISTDLYEVISAYRNMRRSA